MSGLGYVINILPLCVYICLQKKTWERDGRRRKRAASVASENSDADEVRWSPGTRNIDE